MKDSLHNNIESAIMEFLEGMDLEMEHYYNSDIESDDFGENMEDGIEHGYAAGMNDAKIELYHIFKNRMKEMQ